MGHSFISIKTILELFYLSPLLNQSRIC